MLFAQLIAVPARPASSSGGAASAAPEACQPPPMNGIEADGDNPDDEGGSRKDGEQHPKPQKNLGSHIGGLKNHPPHRGQNQINRQKDEDSGETHNQGVHTEEGPLPPYTRPNLILIHHISNNQIPKGCQPAQYQLGKRQP